MLVIRVKRNREDDPAETLCLLEDNGASLHPRKKKASVNSLSNQLANSVIKETIAATQADNNAILNEKAPENRKKLILHRVSTISQFDKQTLDNDTITALHDKTRSADTSYEINQPAKKAKVILTQSKKALPIQGQESCIIVDMMQVYNNANPPATNNNSQDSTQPINSPAKVIPSATTTINTPTKSTKILDPPTRMLGRGILTAIQRGDFNDISSALIQGANPNHQLDAGQGGFTALMAAAMKCNLRMVKRLLLSEVNVLVKSTEHCYALDYVKETTYNKKDCLEIKSLLQAAMVKALAEEAHHAQVATGNTTGKFGGIDDQYVVDIYCVQTEEGMQEEAEHQLPMEESEDVPASTTGIPSTASIITIEGLKILGDGLGVELLSYDSDWSDLADDEDPDSNDERHYANDYPEESDEDGGGRWFTAQSGGGEGDDEDDEEGGIFGYSATRHLHTTTGKGMNNGQKQRRNKQTAYDISDDDDDNDEGGNGYDSENSDYDLLNDNIDQNQFRGRKVQFALPKSTTNTTSFHQQQLLEQAELEELESVFEDGQHRKPIFDRPNAIGRVLRPHHLGDDALLGGSDAPTGDMLRELWNEDNLSAPTACPMNGLDMDIDSSSQQQHTQRVHEMRERTGMLFASNPREFASSGLPKYGLDLSDDEIDEQAMITGVAATMASYRPPKDTVAYDSELDGSETD